MIRNKHTRLFRKLPMVVAIGLASLAAQQVSAHGYMESPKSRAFMCSQPGGSMNQDCGAAEKEPFSIEWTPEVASQFSSCKEAFSQCGPGDGAIASGGRTDIYSELDMQADFRWEKNTIKPGMNTFEWRYDAVHPTAYWEFYITKKDWNPNEPLSRDSFELEPLLHEQGNGVKVPHKGNSKHQVNIPADRSGYHVVLATWRTADTDATFYQVVDLNVDADEVSSNWTYASTLEPSHLHIGDRVTARPYTAQGYLPDKELSMTIDSIEQGKPGTWPRLLAEQVNAADLGFKMGVLANGAWVVPSSGRINIYVDEAREVRNVYIDKKLLEVYGKLSVTGVQPEYTAKDGKLVFEFDVLLETEREDYSVGMTVYARPVGGSVPGTAVGDGTKAQHVKMTVESIKPGNYAMAVAATPQLGGKVLQKIFPFTVHAEADFVFPEGLEQYKAGTTVLQPKDGHTYECKQGPAAGYCVQWKEHANGYEPGIGAHWQEAWIRK